MSFCRRFPVPERRSSLPRLQKASKGFKKRTRAFAFSARPKGALVAFLPAVLADETLHRPHEVADFVESGAHESNEPLDVHGRNLIGDVAFELFPQNLFGRSMTHGRNRPKRTKRVGRKPPHDGGGRLDADLLARKGAHQPFEEVAEHAQLAPCCIPPFA